MTIRHDGLSATWYGYATVRLETPDGVVAYLDPGRYGVLTGEWSAGGRNVGHPSGREYDARDGDLVCVTHDHHYDSDGIERVAKPDATILVYDGVDPSRIGRDVVELSELPGDVIEMGETDEHAVDGVTVRTLPAYNHPDGPHTRENGEPIHPKGFGCGFVIECDAGPVFWPGDTDVLDEHDGLDVSLFVPPIGGSFTMDRHGAADLAETLDPDLTLPIHYNTFDALETDSAAFAADVAGRGVPVVLDERE